MRTQKNADPTGLATLQFVTDLVVIHFAQRLLIMLVVPGGGIAEVGRHRALLLRIHAHYYALLQS